jgi:hypothetical protein
MTRFGAGSNGRGGRAILKAFLKKFGLLNAANWFRKLIKVVTDPEFRQQELEHQQRERAYHQRLRQFKRQNGNALRLNLNPSKGKSRKVLIIGVNFPEVELELGLIKALEIAGFTPVALVAHRKLCLDYYRLAGVKEIHFLGEFLDPINIHAAEDILEQYRSVPELLKYEYAGAHVGMFAVASALREHRLGTIDLHSQQIRCMLANYIAFGMAAAMAAQKIVQMVDPQLALFFDRVYSPEGELFDACWAKGIEVIKWHPAHKSNALLFKRYTKENREEHPVSLSNRSWELISNMNWTDNTRDQLERELNDTYSRGDWYSEGGTQFKKRLWNADALRQQIGLDPLKKNAFIFPHILWDASLNWGEDLFRDYQEWLIEAVRAACKNDHVNWVIKIHPAHVGRGLQEGFLWEPAEVTVLHENIGELPPHIFMIPAETSINTLSLFSIMDYCLTVRGTVGIEAARLGIPVLTAGTGRYDRRGFTIDSDSREQYLDRLALIQEIPELSNSQRTLAERFAYGLFVMRPFPLESISFQYPEKKELDPFSIKIQTHINVRTKEDWYKAADMKAFAHWVNDSKQEDFLQSLPEE